MHDDGDEQDSDDEDDAKDRKTTPRRTQERAAQKREPATRQAAAVGDVEEDRPTEYLLVDYTYIHTYIHTSNPAKTQSCTPGRLQYPRHLEGHPEKPEQSHDLDREGV